jgi:hypothetical protein
MELRDLLVTPIIVIIVCIIAYTVRPLVTDDVNRRYFFPALGLKIFGALALGFVYTFYYDGGDTFKYHTYGSRLIWNAIMESPVDGLELLFSTELKGSFHKYASRIPIFNDPPSFYVARISTFFDLFTFSTYTATAIFFAIFCFAGMWLLFISFYEKYPSLHLWLSISCLFVPSVIFWGSGILKDTVTLACIGFSTFYTKRIFIQKRPSLMSIALLIFSLFTIYAVKKYILFCFVPALLIWVFFSNLTQVRSVVLKILLGPIVLVFVLFSVYLALLKIGEDDEKYALDQLAKTAQITAYDIRYYTGKEAGSGYDLGELDGTPKGMLKLMPQAINVSLFRPYLWEVRNPLMLLSALESLVLLGLTIYAIGKARVKIFSVIATPDILFCLVFSISFAFAVGVSTFNFGTLVRYKIPMLPFYGLALILILHYVNNDKKLSEFDNTEYF